MANVSSTYELKVEKTILKPAAEVFRAIGEGRLFLNCSAAQDSLKVDFRVGGKYSIQFSSFDKSNGGEFLEVDPYKRIAFTWCQDPMSNPTPDTKVLIELKDLGGKTGLTLTHTGFKDVDTKNGHEGGWNGGLDDLIQEITVGKLRFCRQFQVPVAKLFEKCSNPAAFFGIMGDVDKGKVDFKVGGKYQVPTKNSEIRGEFLEIVPNQKIIFTWEASPCMGEIKTPTKVSLLFEADDDKKSSWLELIHEGLENEELQKSHRAGWDYVLKALK